MHDQRPDETAHVKTGDLPELEAGGDTFVIGVQKFMSSSSEPRVMRLMVWTISSSTFLIIKRA